jgi:Tn3 transposase DDE domain
MRVEHLIAKSSQESLNVIEKWNGANSFILYGKGGEIATNDPEKQELTNHADAAPAADLPGRKKVPRQAGWRASRGAQMALWFDRVFRSWIPGAVYFLFPALAPNSIWTAIESSYESVTPSICVSQDLSSNLNLVGSHPSLLPSRIRMGQFSRGNLKRG